MSVTVMTIGAAAAATAARRFACLFVLDHLYNDNSDDHGNYYQNNYRSKIFSDEA